MFITTAQVQELYDTGVDEKIDKFVDLFPYGAKVTLEICVEHPDVFSFGLPGARLMPPHVRWKPYWDKVRSVKHYFKFMKAGVDNRLEDCTRDVVQEKIVFYKYLAQWKEDNKASNDTAPRIFSWGPLIPRPPPPDISKQQALEEYEIAMNCITHERDMELALIFYESYCNVSVPRRDYIDCLSVLWRDYSKPCEHWNSRATR